MPDIKAGARNAVPECVTPGRLIEYLKSRNPDLNPRFESVPSEYMRHGEKLGVRWDYAFYQMILETGALSYRDGSRSGDVKPTQNNFAGLGATGRGEPGESFKDVATGVRAHLEHLLLYSGEKLENPAAERTRKVQEWGVLTNWQATLQPAHHVRAIWPPSGRRAAAATRGCSKASPSASTSSAREPDPRPELVAEVRGRTNVAEARARAAVRRRAGQARHRGGQGDELDRRSTLGGPAARGRAADGQDAAGTLQDPQIAAGAREAGGRAADRPSRQPLPHGRRTATATREPKPKTRPPASAARRHDAQDDAGREAALPGGIGGGSAKLPPPPAAGQKCRVWTASYGGQKALIIKSVVDKVVNYTVLDVNEGAEKREADAFISAYAKEGAVAGEYGNQSQALDKAFELCPEGCSAGSGRGLRDTVGMPPWRRSPRADVTGPAGRGRYGGRLRRQPGPGRAGTRACAAGDTAFRAASAQRCRPASRRAA